MASNIYTNAKVQFLKGTIFPLTDNIYVALMTSSYAPNQDTDTYFTDINVNESLGAGYSAGGQLLTSPSITPNTGLHAGVYTAANAAWGTSTIANARYAVIYKNTGVGSTSPLIAYIDLLSTKSTNGDTFYIQWNASGIFDLA